MNFSTSAALFVLYIAAAVDFTAEGVVEAATRENLEASVSGRGSDGGEMNGVQDDAPDCLFRKQDDEEYCGHLYLTVLE